MARPESPLEQELSLASEALIALVRLLARQAAAEMLSDAEQADLAEKPLSEKTQE